MKTQFNPNLLTNIGVFEKTTDSGLSFQLLVIYRKEDREKRDSYKTRNN